MIKQFQIVFCLLIFISCDETEKSSSNSECQNNQDISVVEATNVIRLTDIIPQNISDSSKTQIINQLAREIDIDTLLIFREIPDSINSVIYAFYRNDTLVKISQKNMSYYLLKEKLILNRYACNVYQQTSRCNPVSAYSAFFFYNNKIISQEHHINIRFPYQGCGCNDYSSYEKEENVAKYESIVITEFNRLKELIKTANT